MLKIELVLAYEANPHAGVVRPFLNWTKQITTDHPDIHPILVLYKCGAPLVNFAKSLKVPTHECDNVEALARVIEKTTPDFVVVDDYFRRLVLLSRVRRLVRGFPNLVVYVQVLHAIHSVAEVFDNRRLPFRERVVLQASRQLPFSFLKRRYANLLKEAEFVVCNTDFTSNVLFMLYGVSSVAVVYPPVDISVFRPSHSHKENQVALYLGSNAGDASQDFLVRISKHAIDRGFVLSVFGNKTVAEFIRKIPGKVTYLEDVSDEELAAVYSKSRLVICPQRWEPFGYVLAEALSCGTPVLTWRYGSQRELVAMENLQFAARFDNDFLLGIDHLADLERSHVPLPANSPFSNGVSTSSLIRLLLRLRPDQPQR